MVTRQEWEEYVEMASYLEAFDKDELPFALEVLLGPAYVCSNGALKYALPSEMEFWIRPGYVNGGKLEFSYVAIGIRDSIQDLEQTLLRYHELEIG